MADSVTNAVGKRKLRHRMTKRHYEIWNFMEMKGIRPKRAVENGQKK